VWVFTLTAGRGSVPWQCIDGESPRGGGADGEGGGGDGSPLPCLRVSPGTSRAGSPPPPGRYRGLLPPPSQGAGSAWRLTRIPCTAQKQDFGRVFTLTAERGSVPWHCIDGESPPRGRRLAGEGAERPFPCRCVSWLNVLRRITPATRPLPRPPPAPFTRGGQCTAIVPDTVHGAETGFRWGVVTLTAERGSVPWHCIDGESPRGGGGSPGRGRNVPSPVSTCHRKRFSKAGVDHPRRPAATAASSRPLHRGRAVSGD